MTLRMTAALVSLAGVLVSAYLWLYTLGRIGDLACSGAGCATVQASRYSRFLGVEVAAIGVAGYVVLLALTLLALQPRWTRSRGLVLLLVGLSGVAVGFTAYLKYLEFFVIEAVCQWCVVSAVLITLFFLLMVFELRRMRRSPAA
jgi:uncharacterized membrane protein